MATSQLSVLQSAKQGNPAAIAILVNQSLPKGTTAKVSLKESCLKIMLESVEVPEQQSCTEFIRKGMTGLNTSSIRQVKVYGREIGEDFPSWQDAFEIVSPTPDVKELARQGNLEAIDTLLKQWLAFSSITSKATLKDDCLRIMLEATEFSNQSALVAQILENVQQLGIQNCLQLKISGREPGDEFPDWQKTLDLSQPLKAFPAELETHVSEPTVEPVEEPVQSQSSLLELARKGDVKAITEVINYLLEDKELKVAATIKGECLLVVLQAERIPDQEESITYLRKVLEQIKLNAIQQVKVFARRNGSTFTAWTQDLTLERPKQNNFNFWVQCLERLVKPLER